MIMLSKLDIPLNIHILFSYTGFWNTTINGFIFPSSMLSPILLNVSTILGFLIRDNEVPSLFNIYTKHDLG